MANIYESFDRQGAPYSAIVGDLKVNENFSFTTNFDLKTEHTKIKTKYALTQPIEEEEHLGVPQTSSEFTLEKKLSDSANLTFINNPTETSGKLFIKLYNRYMHKLNFIPQYKIIKKADDQSSSLVNMAFNYHYSNNTMMSLGLDKCLQEKKYIPSIFSLTFVHGKTLNSGKNLNFGAKMNYNNKSHLLYGMNYLFSLKCPSYSTLFALNMIRPEAQNESETPAFDKTLSIKLLKPINEKFTCGGETSVILKKKKLESKLYGKYTVLPNTTTVSVQWEDKEKSVTIGLSHMFRGFLKAGFAYQIKPKNSKLEGKGFSSFKSKMGFKAEIIEKMQ